MRPADAPRTIEDHVGSLTTRMERVERRPQLPSMMVFVQPDEPFDADGGPLPVGTLWFDTDEPVPS
jgi:hypothetical protein